MMKLAIVAAATVALATRALAADLPVKAPVIAPPPAWTWTGFYFGVNAGGSIGRDPTTQSITGGGSSVTVGSFTMSPAGFIGGGQIGYNYQFAPHWVIGVEGDFQGASQEDSSCVLACLGTTSIFTIDDTQKIKWFATARARFGYTGSPYLLYVTGGAAWAQVHNDLTVFVNNIDGAGSANFNQSGWTIGGGIETHVGGNWTAKLEYLYLDLGSITDVAFQDNRTFTSNSDIRDHIVRVGLNYKPASAADMGAPVYRGSTAPASVWNWTGFYVGVNAGGSIGRDPTTQSVSNGASSATFGSFTISPAGFIGGGQIGYNYQFAPHWVVGVEGDFQGASQKDSSCVFQCGGATELSSTATDTQKVNWFATARARFGYTGSPFLWYVTGGAAWGEVHNEFSINRTVFANANFNQSGWTIGGGVETHLGGNWTAKLEYLYLDLGSFTDVANTPPNLVWTSTSDVRDHIVRVGLNYKLN